MIKKPKNTKLFILIVLVALIGLGLGFWKLWEQNIRIKDPSELVKTVEVSFSTNDRIVTAEVADTPQSRSTGLMNRGEMAENSGMLFIFDESVLHGFWMKDTLIPLDMIFIDSSYKVVDIIADVPICVTAYCRNYTPSSEYRYVLEVNSGYAERNGIRIGEEIVVKEL